MIIRNNDGGRIGSFKRMASVFIMVLAWSLAIPVSAETAFLERKPVRSSDLATVGYDARAEVLDVEFRSGGIYRYHDVPRNIFAELMAADSKGRFFARHIRNHFRHERLRRGSHSASNR